MIKELRSDFETRQYLLARDYELFYYRDANFQNVPNHSHDYYEFYLLVSGDVTMNVNGAPCAGGKGRIILIPPGTPHRLDNHAPEEVYERYVFWVSGDFFSRLSLQSGEYGYAMELAEREKKYSYTCDLSQFRDLQSCLTDLLEEQKGDRFGKEEICRVLAERLLLSFNRAVYEITVPQKKRESGAGITARVLEYVNANLEKELTYDILAKVFFLSKFHIAHMFKDEIGMPLHQYITDKRLEYAASRLVNERIRDVFEESGFGEYSTFFKAFRAKYGRSPREYQNEIRKK